MRMYLRGGAKAGEITQSDKSHKAADVIDKPGDRVEFWIAGDIASGSRACGNSRGLGFQQIIVLMSK